ncbi:MAG: DMT family transporter [Rhodospirillales bacterium]|nr:DMT family transporter [Rhodospirillales bacterium]
MRAAFQALRDGPGAVRGIALMAAAMIAFAAMNGCVRYLSSEMHPFQIAGIRSAFGLLIFVPVLARRGLAPLRTQRIGLLALRGFCHVATMLMHFMALSLIPLATFASLNFSIPLFTTILAVILLGEVIRLPRLVALGVGFAGALVVVRPGIVGVDVGAVLVLVGAATFAASVIILKHLVRTESTVTVTYLHERGCCACDPDRGDSLLADADAGAARPDGGDGGAWHRRVPVVHPGVQGGGGDRSCARELHRADLVRDLRVFRVRRDSGRLDLGRRGDDLFCDLLHHLS